ncbi:MAG: helix-turn-helix domain-containing protein [Planctomycetes bacterium]|nr:helix-turn-helix domain-containing protein [Planctomycetota bacterium]
MKSPTDSARTPGSNTGGTSNAQQDSPLLIDAKAAAAMLAIGARTLWTYTNCNAIPSRKIGRAVRYCPDELRAWIAAGCPTDAGAGDRVRAVMRKGARR